MEENSEKDRKNLTKISQETPGPSKGFGTWYYRKNGTTNRGYYRRNRKKIATNIPENIENKDTFAKEEIKRNVSEDINSDKVKKTINLQSLDMNNSEKLNNAHISTENVKVTTSKDDHFVIPSKLFSKKTCTKCINYLFFGPIQLTEKKSSQNGIQDSCINNFSDCSVVLQFYDELVEHESNCEFKKYYICSECKFGYTDVYHQIQHYRRNHSKLFVENNVFKLEQIFEHNKYFPTNPYLIMIKLDVPGKDLKLFCNVNCNDKKYSALFFKPVWNILYTSKITDFEIENYPISMGNLEKRLTSLLLTTIQAHQQHFMKNHNTFDFKILNNSLQNYDSNYNENKAENEIKNLNISEDSFTKILKKLLKILFKTKINCSYCKELIPNIKDISVCPESHFSCKKCVKNYCTICDTACTWWNTKEIFKNLTLACDWKNCNKKLNCLDFIPHKQICCKREYQCPKPKCSFSGSRSELFGHWQACKKCPLIFDSVLDFSTNTCDEIYWIIDHVHEMLHIKIVKKKGYVYVEIDETMAIFPNNYKLALFYEYYKNYVKFEDLIQKGKIKTHSHSFHKYTSMRLIIEMNNSIVADIPEYDESNDVTSKQLMKQLISIFFKTSSYCCNCKNLIRDRSEIYICQQSHIACQHCLSNCNTCRSDDVQFFNLNKILENLEFSCDWIGCKEKTNCWDFLKHKQLCKMRQYKCPANCQAQNGNFSGLKEELKTHWHDKQRELKFGSHLDIKIENLDKTIYWITDKVNELLVVNINFIDGRPYLNVKEEHTVFPNSYIIELYHYNESKRRYSKKQELKQSGGCKKLQSSLNNNTGYRLAIVKCQIID